MGLAITLSRQFGSGGAEIACSVASELGFRVVGRDLVHEAINGCAVQDLPSNAGEEKMRLIDQVVDYLRGKSAVPSSTTILNLSDPGVLSTRFFNNDKYVKSVLESIIFELAQTEDVLILGQAGQMILRNSRQAFHVRVTAPQEYRIQEICQRFGLSEEEARQRIETSDKARKDYLRRQYDVDIDDIKLYDLTVNTASISRDRAVGMIVDAVTAAAAGKSVEEIRSFIE